MPIFRNSTVVELSRGVKAFLRYEAGLIRGPIPDYVEAQGAGERDRELRRAREQLAEARRRLAESDKRISRLRATSTVANGGNEATVDPASMIWIFGSGRTGSTWLSKMMGDLSKHSLWDEPLVGKLLGDLYYSLREDRQQDISFILGGPPEIRQASIRRFVLRETTLRFPEMAHDGGYVVIKEPNGSIGAPLLMDALPESRMIFLIRDFRDSIASFMDAHKPGGWVYEQRNERGRAALDNNPDNINLLRRRVKIVTDEVVKAKEAYDAHPGAKALVKYEDLRSDSLGTMRRIYSALEVPVDEGELSRVVEKHSWKNVPKEEKGKGKFKRKATPGTWSEDLTPQQIKIVEGGLSPLIEEFYPS